MATHGACGGYFGQTTQKFVAQMNPSQEKTVLDRAIAETLQPEEGKVKLVIGNEKITTVVKPRISATKNINCSSVTVTSGIATSILPNTRCRPPPPKKPRLI